MGKTHLAIALALKAIEKGLGALALKAIGKGLGAYFVRAYDLM